MANGYDLNLVNQALAMQGANYRVPMPVSGADLLAEQDALLAAQQAQDAALSAPQVQLPAEQVMSTSPPQLPAEENARALMSEPIMSYQHEQQLPSERSVGLPAFRVQPPSTPRPGGGAGMVNPVPGMLADATRRRQHAEGEAQRQELAGDVASAGLEQSAEDIGQARSTMHAGVADVQQRMARTGDAYQRQLADEQDKYQRAADKTQAEQKELADFISGHEPKDRRSMSKRVMSALAVALAGLGDQGNLAAGLNIGLNVQTNNAARVADLIQRGIDRDMEQQMAMLNNKRTALAAKGTELGQIRERFGDRIDTLKLGRAMKLEQAAQEIEGLKARGLSQEAVGVADQTIAALRLERANELQGISEKRFQQHYADEQRLKVARYQQAQAARPKALSLKETMDLEGKALDNEKKRRELEGSGAPVKLTENQAKLRRDILAKKDDIRRLAGVAQRGVPYAGIRGQGGKLPDLLTPTQNLLDRNAIGSVAMVGLRDVSGAAIGVIERENELNDIGVYSGDPTVANEGARKLLNRVYERAREVGIDPAELGIVDPEVSSLTRPLSP